MRRRRLQLRDRRQTPVVEAALDQRAAHLAGAVPRLLEVDRAERDARHLVLAASVRGLERGVLDEAVARVLGEQPGGEDGSEEGDGERAA